MSKYSWWPMRVCLAVPWLAAWIWAVSAATSTLADDFEMAPICYSASVPNNAISRLNRRIQEGSANLQFAPDLGYLPAVLKELGVSRATQMLVFSKTSFQRDRINPKTPRALYFNDETYVGYCQNGDVVEASVVDPQLGTVFYTLDQQSKARPQFTRQGESCLICHASSQNQNVPGHLIRSLIPDERGFPIFSGGSRRVDHSTPIRDRWGGWYVTGTHGTMSHLGNLEIKGREIPDPLDNSAGQNQRTLPGNVDIEGYLTAHSDIVALMVFEHQAQGHNLIAQATLTGRTALHREQSLNRETKQPPGYRWEMTRVQLESVADELVKYLLFCNEAPLTATIQGTTAFAAEFARLGKHDSKGRSLRQFDLQRRLFKFPCSYLIESEAFEAMPFEVRSLVLQRMLKVLAGNNQSAEYAHLSPADREAIREILVEIKPGLPADWHTTSLIVKH